MKVWSIIKKIFFCIFVAHICWFLIFIYRTFPDRDLAIIDLKEKIIIYLAVFVAVLLLYYFLLRKIKVLRKIVSILTEIFFISYIATMFYLLWGMVFNPPVTFTQIGSLLEGNGLKKENIAYNKMGSNIKLAVISSEDQLFPDHDGFDIKAIKLAMKYNKRHPGKLRGASTISQQVAKNVFLWQGRSQLRKGLEVFFTFNIEHFWTKKAILERYLNVAEMGKGIFGVQAAAQTYFNKDAKDLTRMEAAMIAASLPNPKVYTVKPVSAYVSEKAANILRQMNNLEGDPDIDDLVK